MNNPIKLHKERTFALAQFLTACEEYDVKIKDIIYMQNGYMILFEGLEGDAILHDGSYGRALCLWETYRFPWDEDDVSILEADTVAKRIGALQNGGKWE